MANFYDAFDELNAKTSAEVKPFSSVADKKDEEVLSWLKQVKDALLEQGSNRTQKQRENMLHYRGVPTRKWDRASDFNGRRLNRIKKVVVNHLFDLVETKVSQMNRLKPAVEVLPTNDEWEDKSAAKVVDMLIKHLWYVNNIDYLSQKMHRAARIFGETYAFVDWDSSKGDLHPAYVQGRDMGLKQIELPDGEIHDMEKPVKTGDVCYEIEVPWRVLLQRKPCYEESEYLFRIKLVPTDVLKKQYPEKKGKIDITDDLRAFDMEELQDRFIEEHTVVYEFWHKKIGEVHDGAYIKFTDECILQRGPHKFTHGGFPCIRLTDLDAPDVLNGISKMEMIIPIQNMINNGETLISKNIWLMAHAKWVVPRGAVKIEQLGNDNTVVQYQGPTPPQMVQTQPNPPEVYGWVEGLKQKAQTVYGSHGISRGEVPKGITAASALQFLNELENERATTDIAKHGFMIRELAQMSIAVAADKYDINDGRMVRIVGENNKYLIRHFDVANLNKNYDVKYDLSTGLPETKSARYQRILDAMQRNPQMLQPERWEELLEFANEKKMQTLISEAVKAADSENEDLMQGLPVALPEEWEDHIQHWDSHARCMQSRSFKEEATPEVRAAFKEHILVTEKAMLEKAKTNPLFQSKLATLVNFPIFYHANASAPASKEHQEAMVQGQANRGDAVTGMIPGTPSEDLAREQQNQQ